MVFAVLFFVFVGDTLIFVSPFLSYGESPIKTRCIDDRLSFERGRHRPKKNNKRLNTEDRKGKHKDKHKDEKKIKRDCFGFTFFALS